MALRFDDVAVGQELPTLVTEPITTAQLVRYAGASGDFNPIHYDHHFATAAGLPGVIAHGMLSLGFLGRLLARWAGAGSVRLIQGRFLAMTRPGDTVTCRGRVVERIAGPERGGRVRIELWAENPAGNRTVQGSGEVYLP